MVKTQSQVLEGNEKLLVRCRLQNTFDQLEVDWREPEKYSIDNDDPRSGTVLNAVACNAWP